MDFLHVQYQVVKKSTPLVLLTRSVFVEVTPCVSRSEYDRYVNEIYEMLAEEIEAAGLSHMVDESCEYVIITVSKLAEGVR